jgi:DNA-binding NarL/FixJ family response regulator
MTDNPRLTNRERDVLKLTDGRPMNQIAAALNISERSVKQYSDSLRRKYGVERRWQLIPYGQERRDGE